MRVGSGVQSAPEIFGKRPLACKTLRNSEYKSALFLSVKIRLPAVVFETGG